MISGHQRRPEETKNKMKRKPLKRWEGKTETLETDCGGCWASQPIPEREREREERERVISFNENTTEIKELDSEERGRAHRHRWGILTAGSGSDGGREVESVLEVTGSDDAGPTRRHDSARMVKSWVKLSVVALLFYHRPLSILDPLQNDPTSD